MLVRRAREFYARVRPHFKKLSAAGLDVERFVKVGIALGILEDTDEGEGAV